MALIALTDKDPLGQWGGRIVKEKLACDSVHLSRCYIDHFRGAINPNAINMHKPGAKKIHTRGLFSSGPNKEWCIDGHKKILKTMGISIYGIIDKFSCCKLLLQALPNSWAAEVPPILYLHLVSRFKQPLTKAVKPVNLQLSRLRYGYSGNGL
ncbi:unnamed protein product [Mycena citricolor]|uniref:Uncharacterized protein n=1 Tax=Mycena citricolor TaxID=2018698 RepID=A0AAD2HX76_9AGAR|nr:unnamed protein product [Mycena citricolor]